MKDRKWKLAKKLENRYYRAIDNVTLNIYRELKKYTGVEKIQDYLSRLYQSDIYLNFVRGITRRFINSVRLNTQKDWLTESRKSKKLRDLLLTELEQGRVGIIVNQKIEDNAKFITKIPLLISQKITKLAEENFFEGIRANELAEKIQQQTQGITKARAKLIARTELSKASTALTQARSQDLGLNWYIWRTALDGNRVRKSHRKMEGVAINWNNPPNPEQLANEPSQTNNYHAGDIYNCRCYPAPIIDINFETFPMKVYYQGRIQTMSKAQFQKIL